MRDIYGVAGEAERFALWQKTGRRDPERDAAARAGWMTTVRHGRPADRCRPASEVLQDAVEGGAACGAPVRFAAR
ncbi:hypothetical protein [Streptacidiphilus sp. N1-5]|uniref:Uncharacterized protein n=1 Tax=Streptacidiphilus cavernicola TaxID=3342716 RepID=A0ABV6UMJ1_9ACTN